MDVGLIGDVILQNLRVQPQELALRVRLYLALRQAILARLIRPGTRLPPSRVLAAELDLGRNTVMKAYDQLMIEGYLEARVGSGTYVSESLPTVGTRTEPQPAAMQRGADLLSKRGAEIARMTSSSRVQHGAFMPGIPDVEHFPFAVWRRLLSKYVHPRQSHLLQYAVGGFAPLRVALAEYLGSSRLVSCDPRQIMIFNGTHQALDLCARLLCDAGDRVWMEEPGYWGARNVLTAAGVQTVPIALDEKGIAPTAQDWENPPKIIFVSPSSQYPTGTVLAVERRLELIEQARRHKAWIIEDDYDNELRYHSNPVASMFGLDTSRRVIYLGTFSKVMYPGLRFAYLVVPPELVDSFIAGNCEMYREGRLTDQAALAEFIAEGHFSAHIKRMRSIYRERRDTLQESLEGRLGGAIARSGGHAGIHLLYHFNGAVDDARVAEKTLSRGVVVRPLSVYYIRPEQARPGLNLGYASVPVERILPAVDVLARVIEESMGGTSR
ncbi:PLP-dependent aminotransferase family protein [Azoarcus sp. KH32C]|uniref:MocR-like pyridoxine biosynthesis transcription factor PdxR n=1 Tax=Azoarcus sp. KH32C TaxID=748247 RepID=UPI0002385E66|nr:PLP-dependent aminotransferase family protein [Azoarcus sp. KH32C]BAL22371.1 transcriptional regulator, GntR family [Azoarcus sp. KH32C]